MRSESIKSQVTAIRAAAGIAGAAGEHDLAARLWAFEAQLRQRKDATPDAPTVIRDEYMDEITSLIPHGLDRDRSATGYARGLRRAMKIFGIPEPSNDEVQAYWQDDLDEIERRAASLDTSDADIFGDQNQEK